MKRLIVDREIVAPAGHETPHKTGIQGAGIVATPFAPTSAHR